ncbi:MAG: site-specific integrase [Candidatus Aminicenantes bacterium]|nr:site-specific integrase [Candidatus Aminicenantes bacterium]
MKRIRSRDSRNLFFKNGRWWVLIRINGKRYHREAGATEAQARAFRDKLKAWKRDTNAGIPVNEPDGQPVTLKEAADNFLNLYAKVKKRSWERDERSIAHLNRHLGTKRLKDLVPDDAVRYRIARTKEDMSARTVNLELACLRSILRKAVNDGKIARYPLGTGRLLAEVDDYEPRILTAEEARRLVAVADPRWLRPALIVWLGTGLRKRELLKLRREDVDFKRGLLTVIKANAKSKKARTIPMSQAVAETLKTMDGKTYFFEHTCGKPLGSIEAAWVTAKTKAEIGGRCRIHDLRHTFATWWISRGGDVKSLANILGHADAKITLDLYCHPTMETMRQGMEGAPDLSHETVPKLNSVHAGDGATSSESVN